MKKSIITILLLTTTVITLQSQEISIYANVGSSGLKYSAYQGKVSTKIGGGIGVAYTYSLNKNWGLLSGLEFGMYRNEFTLSSDILKTPATDESGAFFEYRINTQNYKENQRLTTVNIPLMLQYRSEGAIGFYVGGGVKFFFPIAYNSEVTANKIVTTGYYSDFDVVLENIENRGFGTLTNWSDTQNDNVNLILTGLALESGAVFKIGDNNLYTGLYLDYGLTNLGKKQDKNRSILSYGSKGLNSIKANGVLKTNDVQNPTLFGFGVRVKYSFSL